MSPTQQWNPILEGTTRERALETVRAIAEALRATTDHVSDISLANGGAGIALFLAHRALASPEADADADADAEIALARVEQALETIAEVRDPSLYGGIAGLGWVIQHLKGRLLEEEDVEEICRVLDQPVLHILGQARWEGPYDLIGGLVGFGIYLLERLPTPDAVVGLEQIVHHLASTAREVDGGVTWHTPPEALLDSQRALAPQGYYNLGVAHGVPAVIALLAEICARRIACAGARSLLDGAVAWLLRQKRPDDGGSAFSNWTSPGVTADRSRLAWCYGDLGLATALLLAAGRVQVPTWEREAVEIARRAASRRDRDEAKVMDAGLCHGAAGNGHLFNRLYQRTGETVFRDAAVFWLEEALALRKEGEGIAGYLSWSTVRLDEPASWRPDPSFLGGAAGIGLALLSAALPAEPSWDRVLLVASSDGD